MAEHKQSDVSFHRAMSHLNHGGLHRALGVSEDKVIPKEKIAKAAQSDNKHLAAMARMAESMSKWHHGG